MYDDSFKARYRGTPVAVAENRTAQPTRLHIHKEPEILCFLQGHATVTVGNRSLAVTAGDAVFVNPLEPHAVTPDAGAPYHHRCVCFDLSLVADPSLRQQLSDGTAKLHPHLPADTAAAAAVQRQMAALFEATAHEGAARLFESAAAVALIFAAVADDHILYTPTDDRSAAFCRRVLDWLAAHYAEPVTSQNAAAALFYTQSAFCRTFRRRFGTSFSAYLTLYRLSAAETRLTRTDDSVAAVAAACGFESPDYFARCFKKHLNQTPSAYRKVNGVRKNG